jgi:spermidine synthase
MPPAAEGSKGGPLAGPAAARTLSRAELFGTVFVTGAAVMCIEILGTRIIGPAFGVNLFVWSALLAVTLGSLALGYYVGGVGVDRRPVARALGAVVLGSGLALGVVPLITVAVLRFAESLGPRAGSLSAATLLFALPLVGLGMVSPVAVRLGTRDLRDAGHSVGSIYAVSTAGGLVGTLSTAFLIVPAFDTNEIVVGVALLLTAVGAASLAWHGRPVALVAVAFPPLFALPVDHPLPAGLSVLDRAQSLYGLVEVIDDRARHVTMLRADHSIIGAEFVADRSSAFSFTHVLESVRFLRPEARTMLQIGLGIGSLPMALRAQGVQSDVVEIDPIVVRFARRYFAFETGGDVYEEDARAYLQRTDRRYDVVVHDTFTGGTTPEHLLSLQVFARIRQVLRPGGVLALNFVGHQAGPRAEASRAVLRTVRAVFANVRAFRDGPLDEEPDAAGNILVFASDGGLDFTIPAGARFENEACERTQRAFAGWEVLASVPPGPAITDERNPLTRLELPAAEEHFDAMNALLPVEVWLR